MKRIVSLVLALSMILGLCATSFAATALKDVVDTNFQAAVEALIELEVVTGYPDGSYKPAKEVNRAELAKMLVICMGLEEDAERARAEVIFTDEALATENASFGWARGYINTAAAAGVIKGYPTGEFKPEKTVTYAEALTMMLRALGYGNVMEAEGTWPSNAMLKARELELTDDVSFKSNTDGATRGDIAILLWNMLRTPMWKITSENQGTGMTSEASKLMLNVKFPDYMYDDEAMLKSFEVEDGEVTVVVGYNEDAGVDDIEGTVRDIDLLRLVKGMKVSYLYNIDDEEFLTLTCLDNLVEGRVKEDDKVDGKKYRDLVAAEGAYVVLLVEGKNVEAEVVLPEDNEGIIGEDNYTLKKAKKAIGEDALVIIDGEWTDAESLEEGDVVTEITPDDNAANIGEESFYVVARERVEGEFESLTDEEDSEDKRSYLEVDGKEYDVNDDRFTIFEYDEKDEEYIDVTDDARDEFEKKKGKYFGEDVELVLDYLGNVVALYFGEVKTSADADYNFYVMTGKNTWFESSKNGMKWYANLAGEDGESEYEIDSNAGEGLLEVLTIFSLESYYDYLTEAATVDGEINEYELRELLFDGFGGMAIMPLKENDDGVMTLEEDYFENYTGPIEVLADPENGEDDILDDDGYFVSEEGDFRPGSSTLVYTIKAVIEENDDNEEEIVGIEVEVSKGADALEGVEAAIVILPVEDGVPGRIASHVFVTEDAKSTDLNFGVIEKITERTGRSYLTISGERYEVDGEDVDGLKVGYGVSFRENEETIEIRDVVIPSDLDDNACLMVADVDDGIVSLSDETEIDTNRKSTREDYEDYLFVLARAELNKDDEVEFDSDVEVLGEGLEKVTFKVGDRLVQGKVDEDVIVIFRGIDDEEHITNGKLVY